MAYKDRPLTSIVDMMYIEFYYKNTQNQYVFYDNDIPINIESIGDLVLYNSLTLIFKFVVPSDFPSPENVNEIDFINLYLYNTNEGNKYQPCIYINSNSDELLFGQRLAPGQEAKLIFVIPTLSFYIHSQQSSSSSGGGVPA
jgi:hypothetical protein